MIEGGLHGLVLLELQNTRNSDFHQQQCLKQDEIQIRKESNDFIPREQSNSVGLEVIDIQF